MHLEFWWGSILEGRQKGDRMGRRELESDEDNWIELA
jgi:hypothetical protein